MSKKRNDKESMICLTPKPKEKEEEKNGQNTKRRLFKCSRYGD